MNRCIRLLLASAMLGVAYSASGDFGYDDVESWGDKTPICKYGLRQSPIDLGERAKKVSVKNPPIEFMNYHLKPIVVNILNDGHTANLTGKWSRGIPYVTGDLVNGEKYNFRDLHAHWGKGLDDGTEHSINGQRFSAELHLVHVNSKYKDLAQALNYVDGVLVVGLLFEVNNKKPAQYGMKLLSSMGSAVLRVNSLRTLRSNYLDLSLLKLNTIRSFYTYEGSLTTPPCTQNVRWIVASQVFSMDEASLKALKKINLGHQETSNVRPIQPDNNRKVELYVLTGRPGKSKRSQIFGGSLFISH